MYNGIAWFLQWKKFRGSRHLFLRKSKNFLENKTYNNAQKFCFVIFFPHSEDKVLWIPLRNEKKQLLLKSIMTALNQIWIKVRRSICAMAIDSNVFKVKVPWMTLFKFNWFWKCPQVTTVGDVPLELGFMTWYGVKRALAGLIYQRLDSVACSKLLKVEKVLNITPLQRCGSHSILEICVTSWRSLSFRKPF